MSKFGDVVKDPEGTLMLVAERDVNSWRAIVIRPNPEWAPANEVGAPVWSHPDSVYTEVVDDE